MKFIADLHIHSRYSRATSKEMDIPTLGRYAEKKGIQVLGTGDFTHPEYLRSLKQNLKPVGDGLFTHGKTRYMLNVEVNNIYTAGGKLRRVHNLIFVPSFDTADKVVALLDKYGKLASDGRPTVSVSTYEMFARLLEMDERAFLIPSHIWTPWFSMFGSNSGFDAIEECFEDLSDRIFAVETGLSSDPPMNWRLSVLDNRTLVSNSDAHSPSRLGREANVFDADLTWDGIVGTLKSGDKDRLKYTIEFFPEEGKYHYDGHRACDVTLAPEQSLLNNDLCPVCGRKLTVGVLHRVDELADRKPEEVPGDMIPFKHLVPLEEIVAEAQGHGRDTVGVQKAYDELLAELGSEFDILMDAPLGDIGRVAGERVALAVDNMRKGEVDATPGYDGVFGFISLLPDSNKRREERQPRPQTGETGQQLGLF